jgi:hypothetical protein
MKTAFNEDKPLDHYDISLLAALQRDSHATIINWASRFTCHPRRLVAGCSVYKRLA